MTKSKATAPKLTVITWLIFGFVLLAAIVRIEAAPRGSRAAAQAEANRVAVNSDDIAGVVTSSKGPEAGVWVIAETDDFETKFRKIVVTDDSGRYLIPDLRKANYKIWVRGYGLVDSRPVESTPGKTLALTATVAPTPQAAAQYYPPNYWYSMVQVPPKSAFPMKISEENGGAPPQTMQTQADWIWGLKRGCEVCHQMGNKATREVEPQLGSFKTLKEARERQFQVGQGGKQLHSSGLGLDNSTAMAMWADWSERIAKGEVPPTPPRPQGIERNVVITLWDFATRAAFPHDLISTDKRKPTANGNGRVFVSDWSEGAVSIIDPQENTASMAKVPLRNEEWRKILLSAEPQGVQFPSPYWGKDLKQVRNDNVNAGPLMMDSKGRSWFNVQTRLDVPAFCLKGSNNRFAKYYPMKQVSLEQLRFQAAGAAYYDPKTHEFGIVDLCFGGSHEDFANDKDETLYITARGVQGIGWIKTRVWDETHDAEKSQGWCPAVLDYNGDGKIGPFTKENEPADPKLDRIVTGPTGYTIAVNQVDGSVWYQTLDVPGKIVRVDPGANPPQSCIAEAYEPPFDFKDPNKQAYFSPEGIDVDTNGIVWVGLAGSAHLASFDRSKCKVRNGPTATGQHCPEGWTMYPLPGPKFKGSDVATDFFYNGWVDRFNTLGLGNNVPVLTGTGSDSLLVFLPDSKKWITLRVPYPMGFYTRSLDGRIDDPKGGWKGRGLWSAVETRVVWHDEGGWGSRPVAARFQIRPDPLAK
jgi:streptogramin lyase